MHARSAAEAAVCGQASVGEEGAAFPYALWLAAVGGGAGAWDPGGETAGNDDGKTGVDGAASFTRADASSKKNEDFRMGSSPQSVLCGSLCSGIAPYHCAYLRKVFLVDRKAKI